MLVCRSRADIGVMVIALLNLLSLLGFGVDQYVEMLLGRIQFDKALLHGMLGFLLFAGALHIDINDLLERKWSILSLATAGTLISTFLVGTLIWGGAVSEAAFQLPWCYRSGQQRRSVM